MGAGGDVDGRGCGGVYCFIGRMKGLDTLLAVGCGGVSECCMREV